MAEGGLHLHQLRITLRETEVWRRLQVPSAITLVQLHDAIQVAMGWENRHLHDFEVGGVVYGTDDGESWDDSPATSARSASTRWRARATRSSTSTTSGTAGTTTSRSRASGPPRPASATSARLDGRGACPPEDSGGVWGFGDLLVVMADPTHEEYPSMRNWLGGDFDPDRFDLDAINEALLDAAVG